MKRPSVAWTIAALGLTVFWIPTCSDDSLECHDLAEEATEVIAGCAGENLSACVADLDPDEVRSVAAELFRCFERCPGLADRANEFIKNCGDKELTACIRDLTPEQQTEVWSIGEEFSQCVRGMFVGSEDAGSCENGYQCVPKASLDGGAPIYVLVDGNANCGESNAIFDCGACECMSDMTGTCLIDEGSGTFSMNTCTGVGLTLQDSGCQNIPTYMPTEIYVRATISLDPAMPGSCSSPGEPTLGCMLEGVTTCGSSGDSVCLPSGQTVCVLVDEGAVCPPEYPVAQNVLEGGSCGCTCAPNNTCPPELTLHNSDTCTDTGTVITADGSCVQAGVPVIEAVQAPAATPGCDATSTPSGGTMRTLCCPAP